MIGNQEETMKTLLKSVLNYVSAMNYHANNQNDKASNTVNQKKHKAKVKNSKKLGSKESLASPKPSKPRLYLRWSPTGRIFDCNGKLIKFNDSECQSDSYKGDNACTSNPWEPTRKQFPILLLFLVGLGHNQFLVSQFCDSNLEDAFRRNTCFVKNLESIDLLKGNRTTNIYTINLHEMASASLIFLIARATSTKYWLWNQGLSYLNVDTINELAKKDLVTGLSIFKYHKEHLFPSCDHGKSKASPHKPKHVPNLKQRITLQTQTCLKVSMGSDISFLHLLRALCYPKNDHEDIGMLGAKGDIGFFIGYSAKSYAYRVHNRRTRKIMETMNVTSDELSAMAFEQRIFKPGL
uniref:Integrase, catalytic region, zinc finger, CCHC-type, peptidase aspartic, catalytic n=1 Tax=Tanacetum cinerariifolium TaxID=118510 RepID=A0A6L2JV87_TANCI|nr:integrase, catalytic region, zinc finger, CCHC-type, peptidase aspartic, catalytic [Tanacetum cinerariifolium]